MIFFKKKKECKEEPVVETPLKSKPAPKPSCKYCSQVANAGRSGEKVVNFVDGTGAKVEIINESNVPNRLCYTLNIMNDPNVGWADIPVKYCPFCGRSLRKPRK